MLLRVFDVGWVTPSARVGVSLRVLRWLARLCLMAPVVAFGVPVEVQTLQRSASPHAGIAIDYALKVDLPEAVVDVLRRGVPLHFQAQTVLLRPRWYWRDERVARTMRDWRLSWQPLTSDWRVGQGSLTQSYASLEEALVSMTRATNWLVAEPHKVQPDERYLLLFTWRLDTTQLPPPMQIGVGGAGDWNLRAEVEFGVMP